MTEWPRRIVVAGFGAAGLAVCKELRARGWPGRLTVLSEEAHPPYDRPPLAKGFLAGKTEPDQLRLASDEDLAALDLALLPGAVATTLDTGRRVVTDSAGQEHPYDALVVATGVRPRTLGIGIGGGIHVLRTLEDAQQLRRAFASGRSLVVVGGGFLGLEVAASARTLGVEVTVVEPMTEPMRDRLGPQIAARLVELHRARGVRIIAGTGVTSVAPASASRPPQVQLADGARLQAGVVLIAVGAEPVTGWLDGSGIELRDGVVCDERCQAGPGVWAAGDVARWRHLVLGTDFRIEHRMNATEQGRAVAAAILGSERPFAPVPFFWTDQYEVRIQVAGLADAQLTPTLYHGDERAGSFAVEWRGERLTGVAGWNAVRELMPARRALLESWRSIAMGVAG
jgi:NADPH-dependent 2,4-dienoyl-CoA reductase/sulfur reductase-like enzyme